MAPLAKAAMQHIVDADLIILRTWVEGTIFAGMKPTNTTLRWIKTIETFGNKPIIAFVTYGLNPRSSIRVLEQELKQKHGNLILKQAFKGTEDQKKLGDFKKQVRQKVLDLA